MKRYLLAASLLCSLLQAETICKGITILGEKKELVPAKDLKEGVCFYGIEVPGSEIQLAKALRCHFLEQPINSKTPAQLRLTIEKFYEENHHPFTKVLILKQDVSKGIIQVRVAESHIGTIDVEGNAHTSANLLKNYIGDAQGETIDTVQMRKRLNFMNRNPFRRVNLIYGPGKEPYTTDISLLVDDRRPFRFYVGTDNTGIETIERGRLISGFDLAKIFTLDHFFAYQYTTSYDFTSFQANTVQYIAFLPWQNVLNIYGGYSTVRPHLPEPSKRTNGHSYQASGRYIIPLNPSKLLTHEMGFGFDFKRTNNTVEFSETFTNFSGNVNLSQFMVHYSGNVAKESWRIDFTGDLFFSPGSIMEDESNRVYSRLRPGAKNHWVYAKGFFKYFQKLPYSFYLNCTARGQLSSQNLLPSEQVGLGGFDSVRGYDERQLNYDSGFILNTELLSPGFEILTRWKKSKSWKDAMQFLAFLDYGYGGNHTLIVSEPAHDYLIGVGPAVRYTIDPWLTARLDLGFKLHQQELFTGGYAMWYFSFIASI